MPDRLESKNWALKALRDAANKHGWTLSEEKLRAMVGLPPASADMTEPGDAFRTLVRELCDQTAMPNNIERVFYLSSWMAETGWWKRAESALASASAEGMSQWESGREAAARLAEIEIDKHYDGVSALGVRLSIQRSPKWKDGREIAAAIRAIPTPPAAETCDVCGDPMPKGRADHIADVRNMDATPQAAETPRAEGVDNRVGKLLGVLHEISDTAERGLASVQGKVSLSEAVDIARTLTTPQPVGQYVNVDSHVGPYMEGPSPDWSAMMVSPSDAETGGGQVAAPFVPKVQAIPFRDRAKHSPDDADVRGWELVIEVSSDIDVVIKLNEFLRHECEWMDVVALIIARLRSTPSPSADDVASPAIDKSKYSGDIRFDWPTHCIHGKRINDPGRCEQCWALRLGGREPGDPLPTVEELQTILDDETFPAVRLGALDQPTDTATAVRSRENEEYPIGRGWVTETLVVCINEAHRRNVFRAFDLKARYVLWFTPLMGSGPYRKIIVFPDYAKLRSQAHEDTTWQYIEDLRLKLHKDGELIVL